MPGMFWEDYEAGWQVETAQRTVTEWDLMQFVTACGMTESLFLDEEYVRTRTPYGRRIVPGALIFSYAEGLVMQTGILEHTGIAFLAGSLEIERPLFVGDGMRVHIVFHEKRPTSNPERGIVVTENRVINQRGETVMRYFPRRLIRRRT
ncbi:MAG: MaoC family dehydratase N-terminal domain-containing protein [Hydrogenibacillus schlegelii]|nr:MaoC family dehydratase N-terminal domain-containing protein [Hydrogenibacillus schlegelii]